MIFEKVFLILIHYNRIYKLFCCRDRVFTKTICLVFSFLLSLIIWFISRLFGSLAYHVFAKKVLMVKSAITINVIINVREKFQRSYFWLVFIVFYIKSVIRVDLIMVQFLSKSNLIIDQFTIITKLLIYSCRCVASLHKQHKRTTDEILRTIQLLALSRELLDNRVVPDCCTI